MQMIKRNFSGGSESGALSERRLIRFPSDIEEYLYPKQFIVKPAIGGSS
jgi:hypothetical protein